MTFFTADGRTAVEHRAGRLRRVTRGLYTDDLTTPLDEQVRRGWRDVAALTVPGAVVTARSGPTGAPVDGVLFVAGGRARPLVLPGLTIVSVPGPGPAHGDVRLADALWWATEARWVVDNARPSRAVGGRPPATLSRAELHDHVARLVASRAAVQVDRVLEAVARYAADADLVAQGESVAVFVESARGGRPTVETASTAMRSARIGHGVDAARLDTLARVVGRLADVPPQVLPAAPGSVTPFFEAYFSNFIEGTEFTVDEARRIVVEHQVPDSRPEDAHDVLGTYAAIVDDALGGAVTRDPGDFVELVRARHRHVMEGRPAAGPGRFKDRANRAGVTEFVAPHLVEGTLREGWRLADGLLDPFARAVYAMFLVSEVHPFADGNGRVARLTMNAELTARAETRVVLPTILRADYMSALVKATTHAEPSGLVTVLGYARRHTAQMDYGGFDAAVRMLTATHAFTDSREAERGGVRLLLPSALEPEWRYPPP
ncbi:Fic family protein [Cellulomonas sp. S1-8]|uniref:Fic family protein n=1 Tax=Cellulomonas sp. S1-8 TaxID=2904790 RepID=UPI002242F84C|nr:Fic family protein [Cellulomonas sp. S1-8]UZN03983.1 Fic family protein [Cellulomonas sp. S1-8]